MLLCQPRQIKPFSFLWISEVLGSVLDASFLVPALEKWGALSQHHRLCRLTHLSCLSFLTLVCKVTYTVAPPATSGREGNFGLGLFLCWNTTYAFQEWSIFGILREKQNHHQQMPPFPRAQDRLLWGAADIAHTGTRKEKGVTMNPGSAREFLDGDSGKERL